MKWCKCKEEDKDEESEECAGGFHGKGCGKMMYFCGECFRMVKQPKGVKQCTCSNGVKKLGDAKERFL